MKRSFGFSGISDPLPVVFLACFSLALCVLPFCFSRLPATPLWPGYRVLAVEASRAELAGQLLAAAGADGLVSWEGQMYPADTLQGTEYRHAGSCRGSYYRGIRRWFFDERAGMRLFYIPFPETAAAQRQYYAYITQTLAPVAGAFTLERPPAAGTAVYGVIFFVAAVAACCFLRQFPALFFILPFCVPLLTVRTYAFFLASLFEFSAALFFVCLGRNDGFSPFDRKLCRRAFMSPFFVFPAAAGLAVSWLSGWQGGVAGISAAGACCCGGMSFYGIRRAQDKRRLHPRLFLVKLIPAADFTLPVRTFAVVAGCFLAATLSGLTVFAVNGGEQRGFSVVPASVPCAESGGSSAAAFSADNFNESLRQQAADPALHVPALAEYVAQQWFERARLYIPAATAAAIESGGIQPVPQPLTVARFIQKDGKIEKTEETAAPEELLSGCLENLPPLEQMMLSCGRFVPVRCTETDGASSALPHTAGSVALPVIPAVFLPLAVFGLCFVKLYRSGRRQNHFFQVLLNVRSSEQ